MTSTGPGTTYRYVADGSLTTAANADAWARLRDPRLLAALVVVGLGFGLASSLSTNAASLPDHLGEVLVIGLVWGAAWLAFTAALIAVLVATLGRVAHRRTLTRLFPAGSVTEVELAPEALVIRRPASAHAIPYREIAQVRQRGSFVRIVQRRRLTVALLPVDLLPPEAVEVVRARSRGLLPLGDAADAEATGTDRQFVVPPGWAAHVAAVLTRGALHRPALWTRFALSLLVSALLATAWGNAWLVLLAPAFLLVSLGLTYGLTRRAVGAALPVGSVASTTFLGDRLVSRNASGVREITHDGVESVALHDDVVLLHIASEPRPLAIARALLPDDVLGRLRAESADA